MSRSRRSVKPTPVTVVKQRKEWDCGVAALAMVLRKPYGDISHAVRLTIPVLPRRGLGLYHLERLARHFGRTFHRIYKRRDYLTQFKGVGILGVEGEQFAWSGHWVVVKDGVVIDPDNDYVYGLDEYFRVHKAKPLTLLWLKP